MRVLGLVGSKLLSFVTEVQGLHDDQNQVFFGRGEFDCYGNGHTGLVSVSRV